MNLIKLGAAALNQTPLDWKGNVKNITDAIDQAFSEGVNVLCLPELCITGYGCEDTFFMPSTLERAWRAVLQVRDHIGTLPAKERGTLFIVAVGAPVVWNGGIYNCSIFIGNDGVKGSIMGIVPKKNLCSDGVHYESRWFKAWHGDDHEDYYWYEPGLSPDREVKKTAEFGHLIINCGAASIGVEICEDAWVADRPGVELSKQGVNVIINPSASHFSFGKDKVRQRFIEEGSRAFKCAYVYANLLGNESGRIIFDGDTYIASNGKIVSKGRRFSFNNTILTTAVVNLDKCNSAQYQNGSHSPAQDIKQINDHMVSFGDFTREQGDLHPIDKVLYSQYYDLGCDNDCFTRAVALGLWDYMRKSHSKGFVLSLSGGADSAVVACLVRSMVICAYNEFGQSGLWDKLYDMGINLANCMAGDEHKTLSPESFIKKTIGELLTCVYQGTENSSEETEKAAFNLAVSMGARFHTIDVQPMVDCYKQVASDMVNRPLTWEEDDIALQNIQARVRAPSVWMLANIKGALLLSTSNRSEAAVGYATMDGDTCGGLSPIAGVSKQFLLQWMRAYSSSDHEFGGLYQIFKLKPTAELRPQEDNQTDEDDLMPYDILERIEKMAVGFKMSPSDIVSELEGNGCEQATLYVCKFFKLFTRNQWKRERYAPAFHLDDQSLDPKTFYRFPILNSGFEEELEEIMDRKMTKVLE